MHEELYSSLLTFVSLLMSFIMEENDFINRISSLDVFMTPLKVSLGCTAQTRIMLACLQHQHRLVHQLPCVTKVPDTPVHQHSELSSEQSHRYPSPAELDAYAQRMADSPLSIKIFPTNIRVPQHKHINRTVNGLDTSGQHFSSCSHPSSTGHRGLLAIVKTPAAARGASKSSEGRRGKLSPIQMAVAPYVPPSNRRGHQSYDVGLRKALKGPNVPAASNAVMSVCRGIIQHTSRPSNCSPAFLAATAASCSDSGFTVAGSSLSGRVYSGAVLPTQSADVSKAAGLVDGLDYRQQHHTQASLRTYGAVVSHSPGVSARLSCGPHNVTAGAGGSRSSTHCFSLLPPWNCVLGTPDSESYNQHELPPGSCMGLRHPQLHPHSRGCPRPCQASLLSSSLRSLESLISEIHPPCIKERMLGRGCDTTSVTRLLDHPDAHIHWSVFR